MAIISLICNVQRTSTILERAFRVLNREQVTVQVRQHSPVGHCPCLEPCPAGAWVPRFQAPPVQVASQPSAPPPPGAQMMSQGASKTNIALIVDDAEAKAALRALHVEFFGSA